jgi:hypothetical protein
VAELTIEQKRAMAMAQARMRMGQKPAASAPAAPRFDSVPTQFGGSGGAQITPTPPQSVGQQVVGSLRDAAMGIPKLAALPVDIGIMAVNAGQSLLDPSAQPYRTVAEAADQSLNAMGVPQTRNPLIRAINEGVGGGAVSIGAKGVQIGREAFVPPASVQSAAQRRAGRAVREVAGSTDERAILAERLRNFKSPVQGVQPTVAEAVQGMPEGAPLQALQQSVARVSGDAYGSPSIQFGRQMAGNQAARDTAADTLGATHGAKREEILGNANQLSRRLSMLGQFVKNRMGEGNRFLQEAGKAQADEAIAANRVAGKGPTPSPMLDRASALRSRPSSADSYLRPASAPASRAGATGDYISQGKKAGEAAGDILWESDKANLEAAGALLEKELLENTGLVSLGPESLLAGVKSKATDPRVYANEISSKTYQAFVDDIARITQPDGSIDARALDEVRKSFGPKLSALFQKEGWNVKDASFAKAMRSAQSFIDDAIEAAGGTGYKDELARYSKGIQGIQDDALRSDEMYRSAQPTSVPLANLIDQQTMHGTTKIPPWVSWKLTLGKTLLNNMRQQAEPQVVNEISKMLRKPDDMAFALDERNAQKATEALQRALMQYGRRVPGAVGGSRE